ncbi:UDP-N-acetylglucosamine pyrophosphorylase [Quaeritorhiza haematococci]|nr:UDP-N-acetylglucosamine pyrophosphorylase [Quaeritorhiza haematococci]
MASYETLKDEFEKGGQGHVFKFYDSLTQDQKDSLLASLRGINVTRVNSIFNKAVSSVPTTGSDGAAAPADVKPLPAESFDSVISADKAKVAKWRETGLKLIAENKVAVILLAGGQGTRLGSSAPKGCYDIGLPSHKSLFQLQAERILRLQKVAEQYRPEGSKTEIVIPWYVMTSGPTRHATEDFFKTHNYFGFKRENVIFFEQGVLPAFTNDGKIFLESKHSPAVAPDGNGGIYAALRGEGGVLADLEKRGIPYIHAYCVDNCLVKVADPVFIGYCVQKNADCGAKCVPKSSPSESVGVICLKNNKFAVVEYSEIDPKMAEATNPDGSLVYNAANIANHFYTTEFLKKIESIEGELEYHIARKKIKHVNLETGEQVSPKESNGIKLELFIFDVFPFTERMAVLEVPRKEEFSPLKNAPGSKSDCPETSRADILSQHVRFVEAAGGSVVKGDGDDKESTIPTLEISPLVTYDGEGLESLKGVTIKTPKYVTDIHDVKSLAH